MSANSPKFFSTVEGCELDPRKLDKAYWKKHTLERVKFSEAVDAVLKDTGDQCSNPLMVLHYDG